MPEETQLQPDHQTSMRAWEQTAPWYRRFSMRIGLEGKLILCFMSVLCAAMGIACNVFINETHERLADIMGEQARQVATALALSSERLAQNGNWTMLNRRGQELIKSRNILFVGYMDADATATAVASRDLDFGLKNLRFDSQALMQVIHRRSPTFGEYLEVIAPILTIPSIADEDGVVSSGPRLLGYVAVGISQAREDAQLYRVKYLVIGISCVMVILALPIAVLLVHRVFLPIRKLVSVTRQIIRGNLEIRAEVHRPDVIGDLSRGFDEMVMRVKKHQQDLAHANACLAEANHDLERRIEQRTVQLETANVRLSSEITEKEDFLRAVSHDLNAPLRNISGMATMLLTKHGQGFDQDIIYRVQRIKSNVDVATDLISELLELSRIKTRRQAMERVDVGALVADLRGMFESDLRTRAIDLSIETPMPILNAESARIRQIFQNLIDNAIKYMGDHGTREIHIGCVLRASEAEFYVRDTGIGIDPEDLDKVFFVFRRGRNTISQNIAGKGIGLASVKSIVETYSGTIWVTSQPGHGSIFRFTINGKFIAQPNGKVAA